MDLCHPVETLLAGHAHDHRAEPFVALPVGAAGGEHQRADDGWDGLADLLERLPAHPHDFDWEKALEVLFQDTDILYLFDIQADSIENRR